MHYFKQAILRTISHPFTIPLLLFVVVVLITLQNILMGVNKFWGANDTFYNNYVIFKSSFTLLLHNENLYAFHRSEYADLYKYSPTFAFFMGVFSWQPDFTGLLLWNLLNVFTVYVALKNFKPVPSAQKPWLFLFILFELIICVQNSQSNALILGLTILSFNFLEREKYVWATLFIALGIYIKIYSGIGCLLLLFYPKRFKSIALLAAWCVVLFLLPALLTGLPELLQQYKNWLVLLTADANESVGMNVFLYMELFFTKPISKILTLILAAVFLFSPLLLFKKYGQLRFRTLYLCLLLIWVVIFNYKAESPTFIITMAGIGIWYFINEKTIPRKILFFATLVFTSLWLTDIIPPALRNAFIHPLYIKAFFPSFVLGFIFYDLFQLKAAEN